MNKPDSPWWILATGCMTAGWGLFRLVLGDEYIWRGGSAPRWTDWLLLLCGIVIIIYAIFALWRDWHTPKPPVNIDEEAARAEVELDAMYLREHGTPPEKPKKDD